MASPKTNVSQIPPREITLLYAVSDGLHFFKSDDLPGFLLTDRNLNKLYCSLEEQISWFVHLKFNSDVHYKLQVNYPTFVQSLEGSVFNRPKVTATQEVATTPNGRTDGVRQTA